ncbi:TIGR02147 family protein [Bdellovibrio sp. HCB337]|uniref:TIGR02147 family protein n=1 Tax=Bdellovibrio sp. HCB337 TaxID=3394358 RepID=UPI0039A5B7B1
MKNAENHSLFEYKAYKDYLISLVGPRDQRSGHRAAMAKALTCQPTYISQVLYGHAHLSLEQGELLSEHLGHTSDEKQFFLMLIQKDRAGTKRLERFFQEQMAEILRKRLVLTERLGAKTVLPENQQAIYYSSWQYAAVHVAITIPELQTFTALCEHLRISKSRLTTILEFLCSSGLAKQEGTRFITGDVQLRLGNTSPNIIKHHTNWRQQAIESLERETLQDLHYSGVVSLSEEDAIKIKDETMKFIQETIKTIKTSKEEKLFCLNLDFFDVKKI